MFKDFLIGTISLSSIIKFFFTNIGLSVCRQPKIKINIHTYLPIDSEHNTRKINEAVQKKILCSNFNMNTSGFTPRRHRSDYIAVPAPGESSAKWVQQPVFYRYPGMCDSCTSTATKATSGTRWSPGGCASLAWPCSKGTWLSQLTSPVRTDLGTDVMWREEGTLARPVPQGGKFSRSNQWEDICCEICTYIRTNFLF